MSDKALNTKKKKRFYQRPLGITLIVILVILIGGGITAFALRDHILKAFLGPVQYYIYKEGSGIYDLSEQDYELNGDITLSGESTSLASWSGSSSSKIGINVLRSSDQNKTQVDINFMKFLGFDIKQDGNYLFVAINNMNLATADMTKTKKSTGKSTQKNKSKIKSVSDMGSVELMEWAYDFSKECISESFPKGNIIENTKDFNGTDCDVTTFVIDSAVRRNVLYKMADNLESNKTTENLFGQVYENVYGGVSSFFGVKTEEFNAKEAACSMRRIASDIESDDSKIIYSVYYDGGKIVNRVLKTYDGEVTFSTYEDRDGDVVSFDFSGACAGKFSVKDSVDVSGINLKNEKKNAVSMEEMMDELGKLSIGKLLGFDSIVPKDEIQEGSIFDDMNSESEEKSLLLP